MWDTGTRYAVQRQLWRPQPLTEDGGPLAARKIHVLSLFSSPDSTGGFLNKCILVGTQLVGFSAPLVGSLGFGLDVCGGAAPDGGEPGVSPALHRGGFGHEAQDRQTAAGHLSDLRIRQRIALTKCGVRHSFVRFPKAGFRRRHPEGICSTKGLGLHQGAWGFDSQTCTGAMVGQDRIENCAL